MSETPTPPTITRTVSHVGGVAVLAIEPALAPHPHPAQNGKMVPFQGVVKALLEDGSEVYLCTGADGKLCEYSSANPKSVTSHRAGSHPLKPKAPSMYPDAVLRRIVTEAEKARRAGVRGYCEKVAEIMNGSGIPPVHGETWTPAMVSRLYRSHYQRLSARQPRAAQVTPRSRRAVAVNGAIPAGLEPGDLEAVQTFVVIAPVLAKALDRLAKVVAQGVPAELVEKARKYDELQALLGKS